MRRLWLFITFSLILGLLTSKALALFFFFWEIDGHLFTTYVVAHLAEVDHERAYTLAYFTEFPDRCEEYSATYVGPRFWEFWNWWWRADIMAVLHSLHGGELEAVPTRQAELTKLVKENFRVGNEFDWETGLMIHALGDSFAHTYEVDGNPYAYGWLFGHLFAGHAPDDILNNKAKYLAFIKALFSALSTGSKSATLKPLISKLEISDQFGSDSKKILSEMAEKKKFPVGKYIAQGCALTGIAREDVEAVMEKMKKRLSDY